MTPTAAEFIATYNTPGVVAFARKHGHEISGDPREAYSFLMQAWNSDPEAVKAGMKELHPHAAFMGLDEKRNNRYRNFDFSQFEDAGHSAMDILERGFNKGKEMATSLINNNSNNGANNQSPIKDHTKEILTYGAVLLAGIFIGKFLMK